MLKEHESRDIIGKMNILFLLFFSVDVVPKPTKAEVL